MNRSFWSRLFSRTDQTLNPYDRCLIEYLELWAQPLTEEEFMAQAQSKFGFDEGQIDFVASVLTSAAHGTIRNWSGQSENPWLRAAERIARSSRGRRLLNDLKRHTQ